MKDKQLNQVIRSIVKVPKHIQEAVLMAYVNKCRELYQIAFFQWRKMFPTSKKYHEDEVVELINDRMEYTFQRNLENMNDSSKLKITAKT